MAKLQQFQSQKLVQKLELKPKMLQSLQMLAMPIMQLEMHLKHELINNPMLELAEENYEPETISEKEEEQIEDKEIEKTIEEAKELSEILDEWKEYHSSASSSSVADDDFRPETVAKAVDDIKKEFLEQLDKYNLTENEEDFAVDLIESCDSYGFLPNDFEIQKFAADYFLTIEKANELHEIILNLHPKGIGAKSIEQCLIVQVEEDIPNQEAIINIIKKHFDDLIHRRYHAITSDLGICNEVLKECIEIISKLDPRPGLRLLNSEVKYIIPDVLIKEVDDDYVVMVNDSQNQRLALNKRYLSMIKKRKDKQTIEYVRNKINSAKFLIKSMYMRNRTLERVTLSIIKHQHAFFYENSGILEPLNYAAIASDLQVNESTISRVVKEKYADTPFGIMCLKDFFSSTAGKDRNYESVSQQKVKHLVQHFVDKEDRNSPLSDQELVKMLKSQGISVSRRVVAKYRENMGILNSRLRKKR